MTTRAFTISTLLSAGIAWVIWLLIVTRLNPIQAGALGYTLFYLALFLATASTFAILGYGIRRLLAPEIFASYAVRTSLRQGVLVALLLDSLLLLQQSKLYYWWVAVGGSIVVLLIEVVFLNYDRYNRRRHTKNISTGHSRA